MVGSIYFIDMPYSDFKKYKARPILVFKSIDKNDILILPLTTNLQRDGITISNNDLESGNLKKESVLIVPKITAIDKSLINNSNLIATLKQEKFNTILKEICIKFNC